MEHRTDLIRDRLVAYARDTLHIFCSTLPQADWLTMPLQRVYRFGWIPPIDLDAIDVEDNLIAILSPEMIATVTQGLTDDELDVYLTVIEATMAAFVEHQGEPPEDIERQLENQLWAEAPHAIELRSRVEMQALDAGIVPVCN